MIRFQCPNCGVKLNAKDEKAGRTAPCPKCQTPVKVEEVVEAQVVPPPVVATQPQVQWWFHPATIIVLMIFCFPIALILIWLHPAWENKTKVLWTAGFAAMAFMGMIANLAEESSLPDTLERVREKGRQAREQEKLFEEQKQAEVEKTEEYELTPEESAEIDARLKREMHELRQREQVEKMQKQWNQKIRSEEQDRRERLGLPPLRY
jgi:hypothetical protein